MIKEKINQLQEKENKEKEIKEAIEQLIEMKKEAEKKEAMENPLYNESNSSNIYDIPGILHPEYPKELRNLFMKYKEVFHSKINR